MGFIIRGFIWDIPILIFAYVLFWGPKTDCPSSSNQWFSRHRHWGFTGSEYRVGYLSVWCALAEC